MATGAGGVPGPEVTTPRSFPTVQAPPRPELHFTRGDAATVQWKSVGPLASRYVIELRESTTSSSNLFTRSSPNYSTESLELCIQGLEPGRSYIACVRTVAQDGAESSSSPWSPWLTLPSMAIQQFELQAS